MQDESADAPGLDVTVPNVARIYDYFLGGKDNYGPDRERCTRTRGSCTSTTTRWSARTRGP
ncbi:hypothetical protein GCM10022254_36070 [Actinomadura meridiana]|uniref:Uncharacterized protein n=1 Tax=Actinomadura meridiana TaxID=559626 RepID=A0ABP8C4B1_9ACTN